MDSLELTQTGMLRYLHFAMISLPLVGADMPQNADEVATYIDPGGGVRAVGKWNPGTESWMVRRVGSPHGTPDFAVSPGDVLMLGMTPSTPETFAWVGNLPAAGAIKNNLSPGKVNTVLVPLDQSGQFTMTADGLAAEIGGVTHVIKWSAVLQRWSIRVVGVSGLNFPIRPGYPYVILTDGTAPSVWP